MFGYRKKYNNLIYKIIRLKDTEEIYTEHLKVIYGNDKIILDALTKANSDLIGALNEILKHLEEKIGIFGYEKKYKELRRNIYLLKEQARVQRDQFKWRIDFKGSPAYSMGERSRFEGLYTYEAHLVIELNNILNI